MNNLLFIISYCYSSIFYAQMKANNDILMVLGVAILCFVLFGYMLYPDKGVCKLVATSDIIINNPCKRLFVDNKTCMFFGPTDVNHTNCNTGKDVHDCIRMHGIHNIDNCLFSYKSGKELYNMCVSNNTFKEHVSTYNNNTNNYTTIIRQYVYNFKNNNKIFNITRDSILINLNEPNNNAYFPTCYYSGHNTIDTYTTMPFSLGFMIFVASMLLVTN